MRVLLFLGASLGLLAPTLCTQSIQQQIPAVQAFDPPACSDLFLGGFDIDYGFGTKNIPSPERTNPEWKAIILDPTLLPHQQPPTLLEGFVTPQPNDQPSDSQSTAEVAEEDLPWTHYTHDFTFKVLPDPGYQHLLSSWARAGQTITNPGWTADLFASFCAAEGGLNNGIDCFLPSESCQADSTGRICLHTDMEVEWDNASLMDEKEGFQRDWGAVPEFVWPAVGDRVWVMGRWIFDCGHPSSSSKRYVKFSTEIHPPRALVTYRVNHPALDSFPRPRISAPNFPGPQSWLPVTGEPAILSPDAPNSGPTNVPVTEADIFISPNGSLANDDCSLLAVPCTAHSGPIVNVRDRNYVFDIYPPGADYLGIARPLVNGTFAVARPVPDASLQWRIVDHFSELPLHACGGTGNTGCITVDPIICLLDSSTPPPTQLETSCPPAPASPTRLRVILPFANTFANYFAKSILLGWDDVPAQANNTPRVRTFNVQLDTFTVKENGMGFCCTDGDWRVFVNVGGQWRYMSSLFDTDALAGEGIFQFDGGKNRCEGGQLTENGDGNCFYFFNTPWRVSVQDGMPIHVAVGGYVARGVEEAGNSLAMCRNPNFFAGCDPPASFTPLDLPFRAFPFDNDDRIGTYEFDLFGPDYTPPPSTPTTESDCKVQAITGCSLQYEVKFDVHEMLQAPPPTSLPLTIGTPTFTGPLGTFFSSTTPITLSTASDDAQGFQYRFHKQGAPLPTYVTLPFPVHWTSTGFSVSNPGLHTAAVSLSGAGLADGPYDLQYSAQSFANQLEPRHTLTLIFDNTPPSISIVQPMATSYTHSATLSLNYSVSDGTGSGVASFTPTMDNSTTLPGNLGLQDGQPISLLTEMTLGPHTFAIYAVDNVGNAGSASATFAIIVTPESIKDDVRQFLQSGAIKNAGEANSLLAMLNSAAAARARGECSTAANIYGAFINELQAQDGKGVVDTAVAIMIADAQYLIAHCP
jgi:hypothetical protein